MANKKTVISWEISEAATADLRGRQSVRTTFKLSERAIDALSLLASQLGIKQKSLFDHLIEDVQVLQMIANDFESFHDHPPRVAKTYVISRKTLDNLEKISNQYNTPRDALVEFSIERIIPLLAREKEKHQKRKVLLEQAQAHLEMSLALLDKAKRELGPDDPATLAILRMARAAQACIEELQDSVVRGNRIEDF